MCKELYYGVLSRKGQKRREISEMKIIDINECPMIPFTKAIRNRIEPRLIFTKVEWLSMLFIET